MLLTFNKYLLSAYWLVGSCSIDVALLNFIFIIHPLRQVMFYFTVEKLVLRNGNNFAAHFGLISLLNLSTLVGGAVPHLFL